jgi:hypothetical protein
MNYERLIRRLRQDPRCFKNNPRFRRVFDRVKERRLKQRAAEIAASDPPDPVTGLRPSEVRALRSHGICITDL